MRRRSNPLSERNIKRIDTRPDAAKQTHGFQVCISSNGRLHTKHFSDSLYGGTKGALKVARAYRDSFLAQMPEIEASRIAHSQNKKNKSGHVGISYRQYKTAKGRVTRLIAVSVRAARGKTVARVYRYTKETRAEVLREALAFREQVLRERLEREGGVSGIVKAKQSALPKAVKAAKVAKKAVTKKGAVKKVAAKKTAVAKKKVAAKKTVTKKPVSRKITPPPAKKARAVKKTAKKVVAKKATAKRKTR